MVLIYAVTYDPEIAVVGTNEIREDIMGGTKVPWGGLTALAIKQIWK